MTKRRSRSKRGAPNRTHRGGRGARGGAVSFMKRFSSVSSASPAVKIFLLFLWLWGPVCLAAEGAHAVPERPAWASTEQHVALRGHLDESWGFKSEGEQIFLEEPMPVHPERFVGLDVELKGWRSAPGTGPARFLVI